MKLFLLPVGLSLLVAGCDDPTARQYMAQCKREPAAQSIENQPTMWGDYLRNCMQAKGYVLDSKITIQGKACTGLFWPYDQAACYRPDSIIARWTYENF